MTSNMILFIVYSCQFIKFGIRDFVNVQKLEVEIKNVTFEKFCEGYSPDYIK